MLGIVCAMEREIREVLKHCTNVHTEQKYNKTFHRGVLNNTEVVAVQSGIGKVTAAITTAILCESYHPDYVINVGIAGGLTEDLGVLDCVLAQKIDQWDYDSRALGDPRGYDLSERTCYASEILNKKMYSAIPEARIGAMVSGDAFVSTEEQKNVIAEFFPEAIACDMEGAAIALSAREHGVPFAILRTISDSGSEVSYNELCEIASKKAGECIAKVCENL